MPLYTHLLAVCRRGATQVWSAERLLADAPPSYALSSVGRQWLRPRTVKMSNLDIAVVHLWSRPRLIVGIIILLIQEAVSHNVHSLLFCPLILLRRLFLLAARHSVQAPSALGLASVLVCLELHLSMRFFVRWW